MTPITLGTDSLSAAEAVFADKSKAASSGDDLATQEVFLKLLVAQIQNQNPLEPMEGMEFVTQLAEFSGLEQLQAIRSGIDELIGVASQEDTGETDSSEAGN
jgi:flagellar basal-body rod modification protein FlgD